ncbi:MAG: dihydrofolate reductase [Candidatus Peregrinibacteria bacterium]
MIVSLIVAVSKNNVIGSAGQLPWHLPDDFKRFKEITNGHPVIMGRKTYESIGKPLPNRENIVITGQQDYSAEGCTIAHSLSEALLRFVGSDAEVFIIGGGQIYRQYFELPSEFGMLLKTTADRIYLTRIDTSLDGDTFFPDLSSEEWREVSREEHPADTKHKFAFTFLVYERVK